MWHIENNDNIIIGTIDDLEQCILYTNSKHFTLKENKSLITNLKHNRIKNVYVHKNDLKVRCNHNSNPIKIDGEDLYITQSLLAPCIFLGTTKKLLND